MAVGARDILAGLAAVGVVSSAAAAEPRVVRIDDGVARLMRAGGSACRHREPHGTAIAILSVAAAKDGATGLAYGLADGTLIVLLR